LAHSAWLLLRFGVRIEALQVVACGGDEYCRQRGVFFAEFSRDLGHFVELSWVTFFHYPLRFRGGVFVAHSVDVLVVDGVSSVSEYVLTCAG
jgi:hypothetical protein